MSNPKSTTVSKRFLYILGAIIISALGLYFILQGNGKDLAANQCEKNDVATAKLEVLRPLATGQVAGFQVFDTPRQLPELKFKDKAGKDITLANFQGQTILLNLWATWCVPCREEMPALEKLQQDKADDAFSVLPVNIDTQGIDKPKRFYEQTGLKYLPFYTDETTDIFIALKKQTLALGMPTTLLVGKSGCALGVLHGPANWASENAYALIDAAK